MFGERERAFASSSYARLLAASEALIFELGGWDKTGVDLRATGGACFEGSLEFFVYKRDQPKTCLGEASVRGSVKKGLMAFTVALLILFVF